MINYIKNNIELILKLLIFSSAIFVVTPLPFLDGSLYFWFIVFIVIVYNLFLIFNDFKNYFKNYKWEMLFIICCLISSLINYSKYNNIYSIVYIIFTAFLIFSMVPSRKMELEKINKDNKLIEYIIIGYVFIMILGSFFNLLFFKTGFEGNRFSGLFINPNQAAFWGFSSLVFGYKNFKDNKLLHGINIIIQIILIAITGCRSVYVALFVFFLSNLLLKNNSKKSIKYIVLSLVIMGIFLIAITLIRYQWAFKYMMIEGFEYALNVLTGLRYLIWKEALYIFINNPIFGVGVNNLGYAAVNYLDASSFFIEGMWEDPHNVLVGLLSYTGIVGFASFGILLTTYLLKGLKLTDKYPLIVAIAIFVISILDIGVLFDNRIISVVFWYFIGQLVFNSRREDVE